jgi:hypothetical protein
MKVDDEYDLIEILFAICIEILQDGVDLIMLALPEEKVIGVGLQPGLVFCGGPMLATLEMRLEVIGCDH